MVTNSGMIALLQGTRMSMNRLAFKPDLIKVMELPNTTFKPPKGKAT
jgi:hypothetical protein